MNWKVAFWILLAVAVLGSIILIVKWSNNKKNAPEQVCYTLPKDGAPEQWGPKYWTAFHDLAARVPCDGCREEARDFMTFFHDWVNQKTGKPIFDQANYDAWVAKISELKK